MVALHPPPLSMTALDAALAYRRDFGWSVVPIHRVTKIPIVKWKKYQTELPTEAEIRQWFTTYRDAGVGIVTGAVSNLWVVDADCAEGIALMEAHDLPPTPTVITAKGKHWYFHHYPGARDSVKEVEGLDTRGVGIAVAPPTLHKSGVRYSWGVSPWNTPPAEPPDALIALWEKAPPDGDGSDEPGPGDDYYAQLLTAGAPAGQRHHAMTQLVGHFLARGESPAMIRTIMQDWPARCQPSFPVAELDQVIDDLAAAEARNHPHRKTNARQGDNTTASGADHTAEPATEKTTRRHYWTGPSPFTAVLREEVGWGAAVLRTYDAVCAEFGVVMGEPYKEGRPEPLRVYGKTIAHKNEDHPNTTNAALDALTAAHYLSRTSQCERDAGGRVRKHWYIYELPNDEAWQAWCDDPTLFKAPPRLRTTMASAAYRAERALLRRELKEAVAALEAAIQATIAARDDPHALAVAIAAQAAAWDAYVAAKDAAAPRKRGRPAGAARRERQSTPTFAEEAPVSDRKNNADLPSLKREQNNGCFFGEREPWDFTPDPPPEESTPRPPNDYLGGAPSPPEYRVHPHVRLMRRGAARPRMPGGAP